MGGKRAAESGNDDLRENLAVIGTDHRQAGDELLCACSGETKVLQLLGAPRASRADCTAGSSSAA